MIGIKAASFGVDAIPRRSILSLAQMIGINCLRLNMVKPRFAEPCREAPRSCAQY
jgi:hypothetical protein